MTQSKIITEIPIGAESPSPSPVGIGLTMSYIYDFHYRPVKS